MAFRSIPSAREVNSLSEQSAHELLSVWASHLRDTLHGLKDGSILVSGRAVHRDFNATKRRLLKVHGMADDRSLYVGQDKALPQFSTPRSRYNPSAE